ncbi:MAG: ribonuclease H family protein [Anaerolineales bacterium]
MAKQRFYVVWEGRKPGVYADWKACEAQVKGFSGAQYKGFPTREMAEAAFHGPYEQQVGKRVAPAVWLFAPQPPIVPSLCVDAACDGAPGNLEYRGVLTESGEEVFHAGPFTNGTNNVGEFLAIVLGMQWLAHKGLAWPIYSDSSVAIRWVQAGKCQTDLERLPSNQLLFEFIRQAEEALKISQPLRVLKWDTQAWGEIPADFGRK